jgi:hypothetical protein
MYYVYVHIDPETGEVLYVGMGKGPRAYAMKTSKTKDPIYYVHRSPEHAEHLEKLYQQEYLPHEWVYFDSRGLTKEQARLREKELIKELRPKYNRPAGVKQLKFDLKEVKQIKKLREEGLYYSDIAKVMGCSQMVAHRIVNDLSPRYKEMLLENELL